MKNQPDRGDRPGRSSGLRDLLIAALAVAVLFTVGLWVNLYDATGAALRTSGWIDEAAGFAVLSLIAISIFAVRRWRHGTREHELREDAEARFRALVEGSPAITYTWDAQAHRFLYVSPQVERMLGYSREEWTGGMWLEAVHPDDRDALHAAVLIADAGTEPSFAMDYRVRTKDGRLRWVHDETTDVDWTPEGLPAVSLGVVTDITAMREANERAMEVEARYRAMVERVPAVSYVWDAANEPGAASAAYISPQIETLLGYRAEDWLAHPDAWGTFVHPDDLGSVLASWARAVEAGEAFVAEYRIRAADGRWLVIRDEANPVGAGAQGRAIYQGVMHDVTARSAAEDALRDAEERARSLLENLPVTAYMADYETVEPFTVYDRWIGPGIATLLGVAQEEWLAEDDPWIQHMHPDDRDDVLARWRTCVAEGRPFVAEYRMVHREGRTVWVHEEARAVVDGTRMRADGIFSDITERKRAEAGREEAEGALRDSEALTASIVGTALDAVVSMNEAGTIIEFNPAAEQIFGHRREEVLGRSLVDVIIPPAHRAAHAEGLAHLQETGEGPILGQRLELTALRADGTEFPVELAVTKVDTGGRTTFTGFLRDISERREYESRLVEAQEKYRSLVEEIPVVVYTDAVDELSTALYISPGYERITGYTAEERTADPGLWARMLHPDDRDRVLEESDRTNRTGDPFDVEYRIVAKDGRTVWLRDQARLVTDPSGAQVWQGILEDVTERRVAEVALADATERFQTLVEQIPAMTYIEDAATEREIYVSPQVEAVLGYTPQEWVELNCWELAVHPDDRDEVLAEDLRAQRDGDAFRAEYRLVAKDGRTVWVREEAVPVRDRTGTVRHWQGVRFDVTAEKEAELQLRAAEERYRLVVEELPAIAYVDERRDDGDQRTWPCIYVSPQVETILGFTPEEWVSGPETWDDMIHPDDLERAAEADARHYEQGEPVDVEIRVKTRDGSYRWIRDQAVIVRDDTGEPRWSNGIWLDVTERKLAEIALHEAEARYRGIVEHVPAAIYLDRADDSMETVFVSPQIEALTGYSAEDWVTRPGLWAELLDPEDRETVVGPYLDAIRARRPWTGDYRMRRADGRSIWLHDEIAYIPGSDGQPDLVQGVLYDITERKHAEQALRESEQREREAAERLRALDEMKNTFLAAVSHELRSPLTSILGLALTLERAPDIATEDRGDLLVRLAANARKLDRLLKDLLDIDRLNRGIVEPQYRTTDVGALARRTVEHLEQLAGRELIVETDPVILSVDPPKVERIIENLVLNAARHTESDRRIWLTIRPRDGGVSIVVEDDGPGVPDELREAIFEPFRQGPTASPHSPGTGIGLSLVARFTELHGGKVWIEDREGGGASFHVFLPGKAPEADAAAGAQDAGALTATGSAGP